LAARNPRFDSNFGVAETSLGQWPAFLPSARPPESVWQRAFVLN
jgi:hypothetical protein